MREDYNKIIETLTFRFEHLAAWEVIRSVTVEDFFDSFNTIILLQKGTIYYEDSSEMKVLQVGDVLVLPSNKPLRLQLGAQPRETRKNDDFTSKKQNYLVPQGASSAKSSNSYQHTQFISCSIDVRSFDSLNFFSALDIPAFALRNVPEVSNTVRKLAREVHEDLLGRERAIQLFSEELMLSILRYLHEKNIFVQQLASANTYLQDARVKRVTEYVQENVDQDLSNKVLAKIVGVSEDYIGQFFKTLLSANPQEYVEQERMKRAMLLLRTTKKSIRDISLMVGYKDSAYFCRRFKIVYGASASKFRK